MVEIFALTVVASFMLMSAVSEWMKRLFIVV